LSLLRFGPFVLDVEAAELHRDGVRVPLQPQPFRVLTLLAAKEGALVTRAEIRAQVWGEGIHVEFDQGLNFCIRQVREALGDDATAPRFIETLPRRGYRFLMPVTEPKADQPARLTRLIVLPFRQLRDDAETAFFSFSLPDAVTTSLSALDSLIVRSSLVASRYATEPADTHAIGRETDVDVIVTGTLLRAGDELRVNAQLTDAVSGALLWAHTAQAAIDNVFQLQDRFTHGIVESLAVPLSARDRERLDRDVPASRTAYEVFLRGNQLSIDPKQWEVARELYERSVAEDPRFAPAWARLGRMHHVLTKYLETGGHDGGLTRAEEAFRKALELNPDLSIAHKLYAFLEGDLGRAHDAMVRLVTRAQTPDPEIMAGLVTVCRYCGLLDASIAADARARVLDPRVRTSVMHTWFMRGDHETLAAVPVTEFPYIVMLALAELGRGEEALPTLREIEGKLPTRRRHVINASIALLEGREADSVAAMEAMLAPDFRDPEGRFYVARHVARFGDADAALAQLEGITRDGFCCHPMLVRDPWLDSLRTRPAFKQMLGECERRFVRAATEFEQHGGSGWLGTGQRAAGVSLSENG
jgi:TolB-like protein